MIIGLTGGIGSGKSTILNLFRDLQVEVVDSDQITRKLVEPHKPALQEIVEHFGKGILAKEGGLNRAKLRSIIFESVQERKWLEQLLHPFVKSEIRKMAESLPKGHYLVVEIPLLIEANFEEAVDRILVVDSDETAQLERVSIRDGMPQSVLQAILKTQIDRNTRIQTANDIITNDETKEHLKSKVLALHHLYSELAKQELAV